MADTSSVDLQAVIEKRVSNIVTETLIQEAVSMGVVRQYPVEGGMDQLEIPLFNTMTVASVTEGSALTPETIAVATAKLPILASVTARLFPIQSVRAASPSSAAAPLGSCVT